MLNGSFDKFISEFGKQKNYNFVFDKNNISFKMKKEVKGSVYITGNNPFLYWTKKAVEKIGFSQEIHLQSL